MGLLVFFEEYENLTISWHLVLQDSAWAVARAVKRRAQAAQNDEIDEEHIFALILKGDYNDDTKCKKKLKRILIYSKLKETCKEDKKQEEKCTELKINRKDTSKLTHDDCKKNEQQSCPKELTEKCNELRNKCYQKKRDGVAEEVLLRAVRGSIESDDDCKKKLKEVCLELSQESNELTKLCLDQEATCKKFVAKRQEKCKENVYYYSRNATFTEEIVKGDKSKCKEPSNKDCKEYIPDCDKLAEECQKQNIAYIPPGPPFDPTRPAASLAEDIGLEKLYRDAEEDGVVIGGSVWDATALLAFFLKKIMEKTNPHKHEALEGLCDKANLNGNGEKKCEELKDDINKTCINLTPMILKNRLYDLNNKVVGWGDLPTFLSNEDCSRLESYCFYFEESCPDGKEACMNGLDARANNVLQEKMRGWLHGSNETWLEVCGELKGNKGTFPYDELLVLYENGLSAGTTGQEADFPGDKDCKELGRKCEELRYDSNEIWWPCYTLEQQCERLGTTELLKTLLLSEHKDTLKDEENCNGYLKKKYGRFSLVCAFQNATCKLMVDDVQDRCNVFEKNIKTSEIVNFLKNITKEITSLGRICPFWYSYCNKYEPNCPGVLKKDELCVNLKKYCEPFYTRKALEDALKVELRGKLGDKSKCDPELKRYCTVLKEVNNVSINSLCEDSTKGNAKKPEEVRNKLCEKLIAEVREQCRVLPAKLEQEEKDLKDESKIFKELKEKAEEAMKKSNLVLSVAKTGGDNAENGGKKDAAVNRDKDTMKHVKIVRRGAKDVPVTELEARALDLVADVLARYVELRERCTWLNSDCGIKEDCKTIEGVCKEIDKTCGGLKPLDIRSQEIVTQNVTTTTTKTTVEECKSIKTTDTWVTKTSTHTSTSTSTSTITSTVTLTSTRRCKPTKCTTGDEAGDVHPSGGLKMTGWNVMRECCWEWFVFWVVGQNLAREVARAVKRRAQAAQNVYEEEEYLLALILKKDNLDEAQCKVKLKEYCEGLKKIDPGLDNIDEKLKEICKDNGTTEAKCTGLKNKKKQIAKRMNKMPVFEGAYPDKLKDDCNKLRNKCYQKKRDEVAEKVLLRALSGKLKEAKSCKERLKEVCLELSGESDELTMLCFDEEKTCQSLMTKKGNTCNSLKSEVEKLLEKEDELQTKCLPLLKKCYFYSADCTGNELKCKNLEIYERPGSDFEPTRPGLTVAEEIELQELYGEAARDGVYIGRPPARDATELLLLLSRGDAGSQVKEKCKDILKKKCKDLKEHELLKGFCNKSTNEASDNGTKECDNCKKRNKKRPSSH
ncbi:hypothetical protein PMAC_003417 [Pneumocystis sp. 'macacae']|nr:hypothetical protein PMAC_003417 [Pneumocystis sp. 'macacae']